MDKILINPNFSSEKEKAIDSEIEKLLKKGVIKECEHKEGEYISPIFVSPKKRWELSVDFKSKEPK